MEKTDLAIYISFGSLIISAMSFLFAIRQSKLNRKLEKIRSYDKVYYDACDLLLFNFKKQMNKQFVCDDKYLEKAVNNFKNSHWLEQMYGTQIEYPPYVTTTEEKLRFKQLVSDTYYQHENSKHDDLLEPYINYQSPVFYLEDSEFSERFNRLKDHIKANLSYFSPTVRKTWEDMQLNSPEKVKNEYLSLKRINDIACEPFEEKVDDPYLYLLLCIRHEYRYLNQTINDKFSNTWFRITNYVTLIPYGIKRKLFPKRFDI